MAENANIRWTRHTMNFWWGCDKVTRECRHCYIDPIMRRAGLEPFRGPMRTKHWDAPHKWDRAAAAAGERHRVFTCSMSDFFHEGADGWRDEAWDVIRACPHLDWLVLTKRPELAKDRLPTDWGNGSPNVWLGVTCGHSGSYYRLPYLKELPAVVKFVSAEPLLERLDFRPHLGWLDWIITGCEQAAKGKRAVKDLDWVRDIDRQCRAAAATSSSRRMRAKRACPTRIHCSTARSCSTTRPDGCRWRRRPDPGTLAAPAHATWPPLPPSLTRTLLHDPPGLLHRRLRPARKRSRAACPFGPMTIERALPWCRVLCQPGRYVHNSPVRSNSSRVSRHASPGRQPANRMNSTIARGTRGRQGRVAG